MKYPEFSYKVKQNQLTNGDRIWIFGLAFDPDYAFPLLNYPLTEAEVSTNYAPEYVHKVSEKTGRVLASKTIRLQNSWGDRGNLRREEHFEIFENKEEAEIRYREYMTEKAEEIDRIIQEKTALYNGWLAQAQEPLQRIDEQ